MPKPTIERPIPGADNRTGEAFRAFSVIDPTTEEG
jgi:hypothetical protein